MAGTKKATTGRCRSTSSSQRPASNRGRYHPLMPLRSGPSTKRMPLVVAKGEQVKKPRPFQRAGRSDVAPGGAPTPARATTALGAPVVPDVYMRSIGSGVSAASAEAGRSGDGSSSRRTFQSTRSGPGSSATRGPAPASRTRAASACRMTALKLGRSQPGVDRHGGGPSPVHAYIGDEPGERIIRSDLDDHPVAGVDAPPRETAGQPVGVIVPLAERQFRVVIEVAPGHAVRVGRRRPGPRMSAVTGCQ